MIQTEQSAPEAATGEQTIDEVRIDVKDVVKRFRRAAGGEVVPVDHVSLTVQAHEMVVLLGPSGCGKTTLLRCVAGLERPDEGEIKVGGQTVYSSQQGKFLPANRRRASMIFQSYALFPHMTVFENVAYPLRARHTRRAQTRERVMSILDMVGLTGLEDSHPGQISGGQQQRVALARAVVADTDVVLFDEPLSNVDAKVREQLRSQLLQMQRELGFSGLYVTHDQTEAMAVANRIAVLRQGQIVQLGTPQEVYDEPATRYVGTFIGSANVWDGTVTEVTSDTVSIQTELGDVVAPRSGARDELCRAGVSVAILSRPENAILSRTEPDAGNRWRVGVQTREFLGSHTEYLVRHGDVPIRVWTSSREPFVEGDSAWLSVRPGALRLLEAQS